MYVFKHIAIFVFLAAVGVASVQAQEADSTESLKQVGLSADRFVGMSGTTEPIRRLIGNVRLVQDSTTLRSALATQWVDSDEILFEGAVVIVDKGDTLRADSVLYFRQSKIGDATGNVILNDADVRVQSIKAVHEVDQKHTTFSDGVTLVDSVSTLTGKRGDYYSEEKRAEFYDDVIFKDSTTTINADSVIYFREDETAEASGNVLVTIIDTASDTTQVPDLIRIEGPIARTDRRSSSNRITGRAKAMRLEADTAGVYADTLLINADDLYSIRTDSIDTLQGSGNVLVWSGDVAAIADSIEIKSGSSEPDEIVLTGTPLVWMEDSQLSADTIKIYLVENEVDSVHAIGSVFLAEPDSISGQIQQVNGQTLSGSMGGDTDIFVVGPNAEAIHYVSREDELQGAVRASADRIVFYIRDDEPVRISIISGVEGLYYQAEDIPPGLSLTGFQWLESRRPDKATLLGEWSKNQPEQEEGTEQ